MTASLWGVGCYHDGSERVAWEIGHEEIQRDMGGAARLLAELGIGAESRILYCSLLSEAGQFWPLIVAAMLARAQFSLADATRADAMRVRMFCHQMRFDAVIGVDDEVLDGLADLDTDPAELFAGVPIVAARPGAYERLVEMGLSPYRFALVGPAVAVGREPGGPVHIDPDEWHVEPASTSTVALTNLRPRATTFDHTTLPLETVI